MSPETHATYSVWTTRRMGRAVARALAASCAAGIAATTLTGCVFTYDAALPEILVVNDYDQPLTVLLEGFDPEISMDVDAGSVYSFTLRECAGSALRVETESGDVLGRFDEEPCPNWVLTINEDGTLDYAEEP